MSGRFPDVDWFCDRCNSHLNSQLGFDDNKYTWKCTECQHKNSISRDNIYETEQDFRTGGDPIGY
jgi:DNA-directed RNA polymerase subunit M/transcription elongation factor TFIIS